MAQDSQFNKEKIERDSAVEKVEDTEWPDIKIVHFRGPSMRPDNLSEYTGDFEMSHIDFEARKIEYTEQ